MSEEKFSPKPGDQVLINGNTIATVTGYDEAANIVIYEHWVGGGKNIKTEHISNTRVQPLDALLDRSDVESVERPENREAPTDYSHTLGATGTGQTDDEVTVLAGFDPPHQQELQDEQEPRDNWPVRSQSTAGDLANPEEGSEDDLHQGEAASRDEYTTAETFNE